MTIHKFNRLAIKIKLRYKQIVSITEFIKNNYIPFSRYLRLHNAYKKLIEKNSELTKTLSMEKRRLKLLGLKPSKRD